MYNCIQYVFVTIPYWRTMYDADVTVATNSNPVCCCCIVCYWRTPSQPDWYVVYQEWYWAKSSLFLGKDGTFLCPVTGSRWWSADLGAGRLELGGGWAHHKCYGLHGKGAFRVYSVAIWSLQSMLCVYQVIIPTVSLLAKRRS